MWRTPDGRVNTVSVPSEAPVLAPLMALVSELSPESRAHLDERLIELQWQVADELTEVAVDPAAEAAYTGKLAPESLISSIDWRELIGVRAEEGFRQVELRWRLDLIDVVLQALADIDAAHVS
jgi:hypothetical protein